MINQVKSTYSTTSLSLLLSFFLYQIKVDRFIQTNIECITKFYSRDLHIEIIYIFVYIILENEIEKK